MWNNPTLTEPAESGWGGGTSYENVTDITDIFPWREAMYAKDSSNNWYSWWPFNRYNVLLNGAAGGHVVAKAPTFSMTNVVEVAVAYTMVMLRYSDGTVKIGGKNDFWQCGDGTTDPNYEPVSVSGITTASQVAVAWSGESCAILLSDGTVRCAGRNNNGQTGQGTTSGNTTTFTDVGLTNIDKIVATYWGYAALEDDGTVHCWGDGSRGQNGDGSTADNTTPNAVTGISTADDIAGWSWTVCAKLSDGTLKCWGEGSAGECGDGNTNDNNSPVTVSGISTADELYGGGGQNFFVKLTDNSWKVWGAGEYDPWQNDSTANLVTPATMSLASVDKIYGIYQQGYVALMTDDTVKTWWDYESLGRQDSIVPFALGTSCETSVPGNLQKVAS